jgi:hypothetical protein
MIIIKWSFEIIIIKWSLKEIIQWNLDIIIKWSLEQGANLWQSNRALKKNGMETP